jgi:predicted DNA-binding protein (MmcQ/YjbR family)
MTKGEYNKFCKGLRGSTHVVQWSGSDVWKIGGKVYAVARWGDGREFAVTFKTSPIAYEMLHDREGCRPAPYLASRGMKWIQHYKNTGLSDAEIKDYLRESYKLAAAGLSKKAQRGLGLLPD